MGYVTVTKKMKIHNGDEIEIQDDGNLVLVYKNDEQILVLGKNEWYELTRP
jgi:hypothetical protein